MGIEYKKVIVQVLGSLGIKVPNNHLPDFMRALKPDFYDQYDLFRTTALRNSRTPPALMPTSEQFGKELFIFLEFLKMLRNRSEALVKSAPRLVIDNIYVRFINAQVLDFSKEFSKDLHSLGFSSTFKAVPVKGKVERDGTDFHYHGHILLVPANSRDSIPSCLSQLKRNLLASTLLLHYNEQRSEKPKLKAIKHKQLLQIDPETAAGRLRWLQASQALAENVEYSVHMGYALDAIVLRYSLKLPNFFPFLEKDRMRALLQRTWSSLKITL